MNKISLPVIVFILAGLASPDIIPPDCHYMSRTAKIDNINDYPSVVILCVSTFPTQVKTNVVLQDSLFVASYRLANLYLFWTLKTRFDSLGLQGLNLPAWNDTTWNDSSEMASRGLFSLHLEIVPKDILLYDTDPRTRENITYSLYVNSATSRLDIAKTRIATYSGTPADSTVQTWPLPVSISNGDVRDPSGALRLRCLPDRILYTLPAPCQASISVCNLAGQVVFLAPVHADGKGENSLSLPRLPAGCYLVKLKSGSGQVSARLIVKQ